MSPPTRALAVPDREAWRALIGRPGRVVVDLSLGGWRPRKMAFDLARALDAQLPPGPPPPPLDPLSGGAWQAALVGLGVDEEAAGRAAFRRAHADLESLMARHPGKAGHPDGLEIVVLPPRFGLAWRDLDLALATLLEEAGDWADLMLVQLPPDAEAAGERPDLLAIALDPPCVAQEGEAVRIDRTAAGQAVIDPFARVDPATAPKPLFGRLAAGTDDPWTRAYCACFGHNLYADPTALLAAAGLAHAVGATDLALDYGRRAQACGASSLDRAVAAARVQGFRIASHRFAEAAAEPVPPGAPAPLADYVACMRAWGQVMTGQAEAAEAVLEAAIADAEGPPSLYDLYMLNIAALGRLRRGQAQAAEQLERQIGALHAALPQQDGRLAYVNLLNLSRLRRRAGAAAEARDLHRAAFATVAGVMVPWEAFHLAILEAQAAQALDEPAWPHWLKAALVWASEPVKLSIPDRALRALLGPHASGGDRSILAPVEAALAEALSAFAAADGAGPVLGRLDTSGAAGVERIHDLGELALCEAGPAAAAQTPLRARIGGALAALGLPADDRLVLVDLERGLGFEIGEAAMRSLRLRTGAAPADAAPTARLNPAVTEAAPTVEGLRIEWRRRLSPVWLQDWEAQFVRGVAEAGTSPVAPAELAGALALERRRIVNLD